MHTFKKIFLSFIFLCLSNTAFATKHIDISHESGFYNDEIEVTINAYSTDIKVFYTLDGSDPNPKSLSSSFVYRNDFTYPNQQNDFLVKTQQTFIYKGPIRITDRTSEENSIANFNTTIPNDMPIRANSWKNKIINSANKGIVFTNRSLNDVSRYYHRYFGDESLYKKKTYISLFNYDYESAKDIFTPPANKLFKGTPLKILTIDKNNNSRQSYSYIYFIGGQYKDIDLPIVNFNIPEENLFNYETGTLVSGITYDDWLKTPKSANQPRHRRQANWHNKDHHSSHISIFHNKILMFEDNVKFKVHGLSSRLYPNKSIRPYFNFSTKNNYIFSNIKHKGKTRINFRNTGSSNKTTYLNDAIFTKIIEPIVQHTQAYQPYATFINGEYNGILNARERRDKYYIKNKFNLPNKKIDQIKNVNEIVDGDDIHWKKFIKFLENSDKNSDDFVTQLQRYIDLDNFINYHISEIFIANNDWLTNNIAVWRYKTELPQKKPSKSKYTDGRWRWLIYDLDDSGHYYDRNTLEFNYNLERKNANQVFKNVLNSPYIKQSFVLRFSDLLNTYFLSEKTIPIVNGLAKGIKSEMPRHIQRWGSPKDIAHWQESVSKINNFLEQRPDYQWQHLQEFFKLGNLHEINILLPSDGISDVEINSVVINKNSSQKINDNHVWSGKYFEDYKVKLTANPEAGYKFSHWEVTTDSVTVLNDKIIEITPQENMVIRAVLKL